MELNYEKNDDVGVLHIQGRLDAGNVSNLKKEFASHLDESSHYVIDMEGLDAIDSTGLGGVVACLKYATEAGGEMKLASLRPKPRMVFEITRAYRIFDIYDSLDAAIRSYEKQLHTSNV